MAWNKLLLHLLCQRIFQRQVVSPIDKQLVLEVLGGMEILAGWLLSVTPTLNTVVTSCDPSILNLHIWWWVGELALCVTAAAFLALELTANLKLQPPTVLLVEEGAHIEHVHGVQSHGLLAGGHVGGVGGHGGDCAHGSGYKD